ncbi:MAG: asparagine synthase (glutamine-hydrolyzing) [Bacteroidetes bacterium 43-16]|nr:MAG: asparagine synthase (glutamine-hydrolyzing) [Bacteroidetes bacterium 43-16]
MCGISGYMTRHQAVKTSNIIRMNEAIRHRGPDDEGFVCLDDHTFRPFSGADSVPEIKALYPRLDATQQSRMALGFRRLSILDLSEKGHQPMLSGDVCITFNGEIYNFKSLRTVLQASGITFHTASDTEVILKAYQQWGIDMVSKLNGMFAIVIADLRLQKTFLIRDRLGIKPLFYAATGSHITWCSEIKGILKAEWIKPEMSMEGLLLNYQFKSSVAPSTCFEGIHSLPPAHILTIDHNSLSTSLSHYWEIPLGPAKGAADIEQTVAALEQKLAGITALQMQSDVPVISMMSGGIDSTLITALAHQQDRNISCYTLSIDGTGQGNDELPQARKMAEQLNIRQYIQHISEQDILENALQHISHIEEPYNSLDVIFNASKYLRSEGFKVILSGNGADEVFGGYPYSLNLPKWRKLKPYSFMAGLLPNSPSMQRLKYYLSLKDIGQFFLSTTGGMRDYQLADLLKDQDLRSIRNITRPFLDKTKFSSDYEGLYYYDLKYSVGAHHVYHDDICAMRYSVEMRYPYLDHELIEMVAALPLSYRYNGRFTKPLLRKVAARHISPDNLHMSKKGFSLPQDRMLETSKELQDFVQKQIAYLKTTGLFEPKMIDKIVQEGAQRHYYLYTWQLVSTAIWMKTYL